MRRHRFTTGVGQVVELRPGEIMLLARALRSYMCAEQQAIQNALVVARTSKRHNDHIHAQDVRQHATKRIEAAQALLTALVRSDDPDEARRKHVHEQFVAQMLRNCDDTKEEPRT